MKEFFCRVFATEKSEARWILDEILLRMRPKWQHPTGVVIGNDNCDAERASRQLHVGLCGVNLSSLYRFYSLESMYSSVTSGPESSQGHSVARQ